MEDSSCCASSDTAVFELLIHEHPLMLFARNNGGRTPLRIANYRNGPAPPARLAIGVAIRVAIRVAILICVKRLTDELLPHTMWSEVLSFL